MSTRDSQAAGSIPRTRRRSAVGTRYELPAGMTRHGNSPRSGELVARGPAEAKGSRGGGDVDCRGQVERFVSGESLVVSPGLIHVHRLPTSFGSTGTSARIEEPTRAVKTAHEHGRSLDLWRVMSKHKARSRRSSRTATCAEQCTDHWSHVCVHGSGARICSRLDTLLARRIDPVVRVLRRPNPTRDNPLERGRDVE